MLQNKSLCVPLMTGSRATARQPTNMAVCRSSASRPRNSPPPAGRQQLASRPRPLRPSHLCPPIKFKIWDCRKSRRHGHQFLKKGLGAAPYSEVPVVECTNPRPGVCKMPAGRSFVLLGDETSCPNRDQRLPLFSSGVFYCRSEKMTADRKMEQFMQSDLQLSSTHPDKSIIFSSQILFLSPEPSRGRFLCERTSTESLS